MFVKFLFKSNNEPMSAITHFLGFLLSIVATIILVFFASMKGTIWHIIGFSVFGIALILLYAASTTYHLIPSEAKHKDLFLRIDYSMIYLLIAGTYTPICLITLQGNWGWTFFGIIWVLAIIGITLRLSNIKIPIAISSIIYLIMGWMILIAFKQLKSGLSQLGLYWLVAGGVAYTLGAIAFSMGSLKLNRKRFGMHEIFHIFVMIGSFCHFWAVLNYLL